MSNPYSRIVDLKDVAYTSGNDLTGTGMPSGGTIMAGGGAHRIFVSLDTASTMIVRYNSDNITLNAGSQLVAGSMYAFSVCFRKGDTYTIRFGSSTQVQHLIVDELPQGVY